jgi:hypothetical protein
LAQPAFDRFSRLSDDVLDLVQGCLIHEALHAAVL